MHVSFVFAVHLCAFVFVSLYRVFGSCVSVMRMCCAYVPCEFAVCLRRVLVSGALSVLMTCAF